MSNEQPPKVPKLCAMISHNQLAIVQAVPGQATPIHSFVFDSNNPDHLIYMGQVAEAINKFVGEDDEG